MTIKSGHHYFDENQNMNIFIKNTSKGIFFSIHNNQTMTTVFTHDCSIEQLKGLADFIYNTIQMDVAHKVMTEDSEALGKLSK